MEPVHNIVGNAIPLNRADVDTDQIMPKQFLKRIERSGFGPFTFYDWKKDPDFVTNQPQYYGAPIMLAQQNFGCGSSREHAPWGLEDMGVKSIIAPSFGDIFRNNCAKIGLLCVVLPQSDVDYLMARAEELPAGQIVVSLESQTVSVAGTEWQRHFDIDPFVRQCLMNGLDDIGLTMQYDDDIAIFEESRSPLLPLMLKNEASAKA